VGQGSWRLLLDLTPQAVVNLLDLIYLEDVLPREKAEASLRQQLPSRAEREEGLTLGYPGYDSQSAGSSTKTIR
jgi:L-fuconate dehydratase